jgi:hypothetical protein
VIDLGTEFGMEILPNGKSRVHVFDGEVEMLHGSSPVKLLTTGQGMEVSKNGSEEIEARPGDFKRSTSLDDATRSGISRWEEWKERTRKDPDVVLFFPFSRIGSWSRSVRNEALSATPESDGAIVGCQPVQGRWPGYQAMGFRSSSDRVRIDLPGEFESISLSAWVRLDSFTTRHTALISPDTLQNKKGYLGWSLIMPENGDAVHQYFSETNASIGPLKGRTHYHSNPSILKHFDGSRWTHVAVVYDAPSGEVRHYANGVRMSTLPAKADHPLRVGVADIGNWPYEEWATGTEFEVRNVNGALADFLIAKRPYTDSEIAEIHEAGKP